MLIIIFENININTCEKIHALLIIITFSCSYLAGLQHKLKCYICIFLISYLLYAAQVTIPVFPTVTAEIRFDEYFERPQAEELFQVLFQNGLRYISSGG